MFRSIRRLYRKAMWRHKASTRVLDSSRTYKHTMWVDVCTRDPEFPWMISFPRTGSNWLRMIMELYFEKPALTGSFYYPHALEFTCFARHDVDLDLAGIRNVLYLYRGPVETVFSFLQYHKEDVICGVPPCASRAARVESCAALYGRHVTKWLLRENFTMRKCAIRYEAMRSEPEMEFCRLVEFFGGRFDAQRLRDALQLVTKQNLAKKEADKNPSVVKVSEAYEQERQAFIEQYAESISRAFFAQDDGLYEVFRTAGQPTVQSA